VPRYNLLLRPWDAIQCVIRQFYVRRDLTPRSKRVDGPQRSSIGISRKRVIFPSGWIRLRNDFGQNEIAEQVTLRLVYFLVFTLQDVVVSGRARLLSY
jgi:hypothetical protein